MCILFVLLLAACGNQSVEPVIDNNSIPVASAGEDIKTTTDRSISIDGDASFDPDGDTTRIIYPLQENQRLLHWMQMHFGTTILYHKQTSFQMLQAYILCPWLLLIHRGGVYT